MQATARILGVVFKDDGAEDGPTLATRGMTAVEPSRQDFLRRFGLDGVVDVEVGGLPCAAEHTHDEECHRSRLGIPFKAGGFHDGPGLKIWGWDGNREAPTLSPSFLTYWTQGIGVEVRFHCFVRGGRLEVLQDSVIGSQRMVAV